MSGFNRNGQLPAPIDPAWLEDDALLERFFRKIDIPVNEPAACWTWVGARRNGYGAFYLGTDASASTARSAIRPAHRVMAALWFNIDPGPATVRHTCDRGSQSCVTPWHLSINQGSA